MTWESPAYGDVLTTQASGIPEHSLLHDNQKRGSSILKSGDS